MRKLFLIIILILSSVAASAQRVTRSFNNVTMPDALRQLDRIQNRYTINFIFNDLEDFRVTTSVKGKSVPEAIRQIIGFYPIEATIVSDSIINVECSQKTALRYKGRVVDEGGQPIEFANVALLSPADSTLLAGGVTNGSGYFVIPCEARKVLARISYVGYKSVERVYTSTNFGMVHLLADQLLLKNVTIKGHRPQYTIGKEGLQTNVEGTILSKAGTAEDVLEHVPSVIKKNGTWEVFGHGSALIYLNGRKLQDLTELERLKSEDIKTVEVVQAPGAKYDATARAVIKIKTVQQKGDGFSIDATGEYGYNTHGNYRGELKAGYRHDGLNLFASYLYNDRKSLSDATYEQVVNVDTLWNLQMSNRQFYRNRWYRLSGGFNYDFKDGQSVGARYSILLCGENPNFASLDTRVTADGEFYDYIRSAGPGKSTDRPTHRLNAYYVGHIGKTNIDFNTDLYFNHDITYDSNDENSQEHESREMDTRSSAKNRMVAAKLVVTTPVFGGSLDYGVEFTHTRRHQEYATSLTDVVPNSDNEISESNTAPFLEYSHPVASGSLSAGLRYEYVDFDYSEDGMRRPEQSRTFSNFFPSLAYSLRIGKTQWQLDYTNKTRRPSYSQLSNYTSYSNRFTRQTGNSLLTHQTDRSVSLSGEWKFVQLMLQYTDKRNAIIYWIEQEPDDGAVSVVSFRNQHSLKELTFYVSAAPKAGIWSPQINFGIVKPWLTLDTGYGEQRFNRPIVTAGFNNGFSLPWGLTLDLDYYFQGKGNTGNAYVFKPQHVLDISLRKSFLGDALSVQLQGSDLMYRQHEGDRIYSRQTVFSQDARRYSRALKLTLRYNLNATRSRYKGTGAGNAEKDRL